jgi:uncharacterized protein (TIGR02145 family)
MKNKSWFTLLAATSVLLSGISGCKKSIDYRDMFLGNWEFKVDVNIKHGCTGSGPPFNDTSYSCLSNGVINKLGGEKEILIFYTENSYIINSVEKDGKILNNSVDNKVGSIGGFEGDTTFQLQIWQNTSGRCYSQYLYGKKISGVPSLNQAPVATTEPAIGIINKYAKLSGTVIANYLSTDVYFEYGVSATYGQSVTATPSSIIAGSKINNVSCFITGLIPNASYHFRTKAVNLLGISYGNDMTFTTASALSNPVNDTDGNVYSTVNIGEQIWMAENLKTTRYRDGTAIPLITDNTIWSSLTTPGYCWYNNSEDTYKTNYGALYNWYAVNTRNLCPAGYHVPTDEEWGALYTYLDGSGGKLKETGIQHWASPNTGATNLTGFTALPGGKRHNNGSYLNIGLHGTWWSSSESYTNSAWERDMSSNDSRVGRPSENMRVGASVRCLKDN